MKRNIKPNININRCNAYSGLAHMYAAIRIENSPIFTKNIKYTTDLEVPADMKGGIIVFPKQTNIILSEVESIAQRHEPLGWTIGKDLKGRYTDKNGKVYSEDSLSIEIIGISDDALTETAEELCRTFCLDSVLIKSYMERYQIYIVE